MYDCSLALAGYVIDEVLPAASRRGIGGNEPWRIVELGCGPGACGIVVAAAAAARGVPVHALLTDRNAAALDLAASSAAAVDETKTACRICTARYAFGEDVKPVLKEAMTGGETMQPDIVLVSDVLYAPESAAPLVATLRQLLGCGGETAAHTPPPLCYLAWRPRAYNPDKISAMKAFIGECAMVGFRVREATRQSRGRVSTARVWGKGEGDECPEDVHSWSQEFDPALAVVKGLSILCIEPPGFSQQLASACA